MQHARGKAAFVDLTAQFLGAHRATRLLRRIADGSTVTSLFEFVIEAPNGQQLTCPVAEWATVSDGRISECRLGPGCRGAFALPGVRFGFLLL